MRLWSVAAAYGLWLLALETIFYLVGGESPNALEYALLLGIIPALAQFVLLGVDPIGLAAPAKFSLALLLVVLLSYLGNVSGWTPVYYVCDLIFVLVISLMVAGSPDRRLLRSIAVVASVSLGALLIYINFTGAYVWGRLTANGIQPNFWGTSGLAVALAALASRRLSVGLFGIAAGVLTIYDASARGSLVGLVSGLSIVVLIAAWELRGPRLAASLLSLCAVLIAVMVIPSYFTVASNFVANHVLLLHDPYRGLGTGFTGREGLWRDAIAAWMQAPLLGVGFHQSFEYTDLVGAHNAYLATLADMGICGLLLYAFFLVWSFLAALRIRDPQTRRYTVAFIAGYAMYGMFEARAFNIGNPLSLLFLMAAFYALVDQQRRRAGVAVGAELPAERQASAWLSRA